MTTKPSAPPPKVDPIRPADETARAQARALIRLARSAALATLEADGHPFASLTSLATDVDGDPLILISQLSAHTANLARDARASLLIATTGKGDPLAHPRLSVRVIARPVARESEEGQRIRRRFLARQPKAALYVDFPDFGFVKLGVQSASLNGGFGKAYELTRADVILDVSAVAGLIGAEESAIAHMNEDHAETVSLYATALAHEPKGPWRLTGIDPEGMDLMAADRTTRIAFPEFIVTADGLHRAMMALAETARKPA